MKRKTKKEPLELASELTTLGQNDYEAGSYRWLERRIRLVFDEEGSKPLFQSG